ncbi:MAG TPA: hypothetical protein VK175_03070 [Leadbetterella sp.]|nr:hypothetical protein [Leadbetterella sp.]
MMKILKYSALLLFGFLWFLGCSKTASKYAYDYHIVEDDYRYGDLYRLANLPDFRVKVQKCDNDFVGQKADVALFLAGDSFTEGGRLEGDNFATKSYSRGLVAEPNKGLSLVEGKKILVIETVERHFRERFQQPWKNWDVISEKEIAEEKTFEEKLLEVKVPYNTQMHESLLFGSDFMMKIREIKASLNLWLFGKTDEKVKLHKGHLLYYLDVNPGISSCFDKIEDVEIALMVKNVNLTYDYYKGLGFDEVYLSIIPNKTSVLAQDLGSYNHLIEKIEGDQKLKMPFISVYQDFLKRNLYLKGDSHWNCEGQQIWVDKVNEKLFGIQKSTSESL